MKRKVRVYISGPFTLGDVAINVADAIKAGDELWTQGYVPFVPHQSLVWQLVRPRSWREWLDYDLELLPMFDCLLRLEGNSSGADIEKSKAIQLGIPVFESIEELCFAMPKEIEI